MIKRTLMLIEARNVINWFNSFQEEKIKELPIKIQWNLLSGVKELQPVVGKFEDFKKRLETDLQNEYFGNDEKSEDFEREQKNENGDIIYGDDEKPVIENLRKIKDDYVEEYKNKVNELNAEINKLLIETTTYNFKEINLDDVVDSLREDTKINLDDISMMSFIDISSADANNE